MTANGSFFRQKEDTLRESPQKADNCTNRHFACKWHSMTHAHSSWCPRMLTCPTNQTRGTVPPRLLPQYFRTRICIVSVPVPSIVQVLTYWYWYESVLVRIKYTTTIRTRCVYQYSTVVVPVRYYHHTVVYTTVSYWYCTISSTYRTVSVVRMCILL